MEKLKPFSKTININRWSFWLFYKRKTQMKKSDWKKNHANSLPDFLLSLEMQSVYSTVFSGWNIVCFCAASLVEKERCKETKWRYDRVEKAVRIVGRVRELCSPYGAKVRFAVGGNKLWSHREFRVSGGFGERRACLH